MALWSCNMAFHLLSHSFSGVALSQLHIPHVVVAEDAHTQFAAKVVRNGRKSHAASTVVSVHNGRGECSSRSMHVFITTVMRDFRGRFQGRRIKFMSK